MKEYKYNEKEYEILSDREPKDNFHDDDGNWIENSSDKNRFLIDEKGNLLVKRIVRGACIFYPSETDSEPAEYEE